MVDRINLKESQKTDKYFDLAREVDCCANLYRSARNLLEDHGQKTKRTESQEKNGTYSDDGIVEDIKEATGVLTKFAVTISGLLNDMHITPSMISAVIFNLDPHKSCGFDGIPTILKKCASELSSVLSTVYNKCVAASCFPACPKSSSVILIFKNCWESPDTRHLY